MGAERPENKLDTTERRKRVIELRREGRSYEAIAHKLRKEFSVERLPKSWGRSYVGQDLRRSLAQAEADLMEEASGMLQLELQRLDAMQAKLWPKAMNGEVRAVDRILSIMKRRAALLGLDEPQRFEGNVNVLESREYIELRTVLLGALEDFPEARVRVAETLMDE